MIGGFVHRLQGGKRLRRLPGLGLCQRQLNDQPITLRVLVTECHSVALRGLGPFPFGCIGRAEEEVRVSIAGRRLYPWSRVGPLGLPIVLKSCTPQYGAW